MNEEILKQREELERKRRIIAQSRAIIKRAIHAGIPEKYIRIGPDRVRELLCDSYHDVNKTVDQIFKNPDSLFKQSFIIIDGGTLFSRKELAFAILFRMIACDRFGKYYDASTLYAECQSIRFEKDANRNDVINGLKNEDILFLNELSHKKFSGHFESGSFFDQLLEYRDDHMKPTIITFTYPLERKGVNVGNAIKDDRCGVYLSMLSHADLQKNKNILRFHAV